MDQPSFLKKFRFLWQFSHNINATILKHTGGMWYIHIVLQERGPCL